MAEGTIDAYNLASMGVNVDDAEIHKQDGELVKAQNCTTDPTGLGGGVRKRPGLIEMNGSAAAGAIGGGVGLPLALDASIVNGTTLAGGPTRTFYWGRALCDVAPTNDTPKGWLVSTDKFATVSVIIAGTPANPRVQDGSFAFGAGFFDLNIPWGAPNAACVVNNRLFYAANNYTVNTDAPPIRVFDGTTDSEFVRIPNDPINGLVQSLGILSMITAGGVIYLTVSDFTNGARGRVFSLDPTSGVLTPLGASFNSGTATPYALCWHAGRLWCGTVDRTGANVGTVQFFRPNIDTAWTLDHSMTTGRGVSTMCSFQGRLFVGVHAAVAGTAQLEVRSSLGAWTVSDTNATSHHYGAIVFKSALYVNHWNATGTVSLIRKFNGSAWSTVKTLTINKTAMPSSWVEQGTLFFGGSLDTAPCLLWASADGSAWTDLIANLPDATTRGLPLFGVLST